MPQLIDCPDGKHDCFASDTVTMFGVHKAYGCKLLTAPTDKRPCPFYKTMSEYLRGIAKYGEEKPGKEVKQ